MAEDIQKEMTIAEMFSRFPQKGARLAQEMEKLGLQCVGCGASTFETIEMGVLGHGLTQKDLEGLLERLNAVLLEEQDTTSITLTKRAAEQFKKIAKEEHPGKEAALRFGDQLGGCGGFEYILDFSEGFDSEKDALFESEGVAIHVEKKMLSRLIGSQIDYQMSGLQGGGFRVSNPNAKGSCSCGQSQSY